jgi:hypothetical protein
MAESKQELDLSRAETPSKRSGGVKGKLEALERRIEYTVEDLKDLSAKEADDKQFLLDRLQQLEDKLMGEIGNLRDEMNEKLTLTNTECETLSNRLTVQKGNATAHAAQLSTTNQKLSDMDKVVTLLKKEVEGESDED